MPKYNIVGSIVLYEADKTKLEKAIASFENSKVKNTKLCLIDNSPKKASYLSKLLKKHPDIDYIFNNKNLGYGSAHNIAIRKHEDTTKYHAIINPDIYFDDQVLKILYSRLEKDKSIGLASTKILFPNGEIQFSHKKLPSPFDVGIRLLAKKLPFFGSLLSNYAQKRMDRYELKDLDHSKDFFCPSISGCFMFFRGSALKAIKGFDERFFLYFEDVDLSRRCAERYKNIVFNDVHIFHSWERGSYKNTKLLQYHLASTIKYFNKWGWVLGKITR